MQIYAYFIRWSLISISKWIFFFLAINRQFDLFIYLLGVLPEKQF